MYPYDHIKYIEISAQKIVLSQNVWEKQGKGIFARFQALRE
jgi:hypothetical protein